MSPQSGFVFFLPPAHASVVGKMHERLEFSLTTFKTLLCRNALGLSVQESGGAQETDGVGHHGMYIFLKVPDPSLLCAYFNKVSKRRRRKKKKNSKKKRKEKKETQDAGAHPAGCIRIVNSDTQ